MWLDVLGNIFLPIGFAAGFILVVFALPLYLLASHLKKRTRQMAAAADENGLAYHEEGSPELADTFGHLQLFRTGNTLHLRNVIQKEDKAGFFAVLDLNWVSGGMNQNGANRSSSAHNQTVACYRIPGLDLPQFVLKPERFIEKKLAEKFGGIVDIDLKEYPAFSKKYLLYGDSPERIRKLFLKPGLIEFCMTEKNTCMEGSGSTFILYRHMKVVPVSDLSRFISRAEQVRKILLTPA